MITIAEVEQVFMDVFGEGDDALVKSIDTVYEAIGGEDVLKLVISLHGLTFEDVSIIHTKFIFRVDKDKTKLIDNDFVYLYDINCVYHKKEFENIIDLGSQLNSIIESNDFGEDINLLSDFIEAPAMFLNYYMKKNDITDYSIFEVKYEPKFKTTPCYKTTFDFEINVNNNYEIHLSIKKISKEDSDHDIDTYDFQFKFMDDIETIEHDTLENIHFFIGYNIVSILDKKLKNK